MVRSNLPNGTTQLSSHCGMALIAVLWIVAALSIMVTGLTYTVRQKIQVVDTQRDQTSGQATGEAVVMLALQQLQVQRPRPQSIVSTALTYGGVEITVDIVPMDGLIPINNADVNLITAMLHVAGGLPDGVARELAQRTIEWRDGRPELDLNFDPTVRAMQRKFEAPEDLMLVPGIDYDLYAKLEPLISTDLTSTRVNPIAAPDGVVEVLAQGNAAAVASYLTQRNGGHVLPDNSSFDPRFLGSSGTDLYRFRAKVPLEAGKMLFLTCDVAVGAKYSRTAPWRVLRTTRQIISASG